MARKPRDEIAGGIFHVFARGNDKRLIYESDADRRTYLALLGREARRRAWRCLGFCLMDNHVHLLIQTPQPNLGRGMQQLHGRYALLFNRRRGRVGHLFQGRYGAVRVESDKQLCTVARYIALNPVASGRCDSPEQWPWSSYRLVAEPGDTSNSTLCSWLAVADLLAHFAAAGGHGRERYLRFVLEGLAR